MNVTWLVLLSVAGVLLAAGFVVGLVFFILFLVKSLGGTTGGWRRLAEVYGTSNPPTGQVTKRETLQVGAVTYKRCVTLGVADEGLCVAVWRTVPPEFLRVQQLDPQFGRNWLGRELSPGT